MNLDTITINTNQYTATIINFGWIDCLACRILDEVFEKSLIPKYQDKQNVFVGIFNTSDSLERIKFFVKEDFQKYYFMDKDF